MKHNFNTHRANNPGMYPAKWDTPANWLSALAIAVILFVSMIPF